MKIQGLLATMALPPIQTSEAFHVAMTIRRDYDDWTDFKYSKIHKSESSKIINLINFK